MDIALIQIEEKWNAKFEIGYFFYGNDLCEDLENNRYDVVILNISMSGLDRIETAKKIRTMDLETYIIFISDCDKMWRQLFGIRTLACLEKPVNAGELEEKLREVSTLIEKEKDKNNIFVYTVNKVQRFEYLKNIICFESNNKRIEMVTTNGTIVIYDTLKNIWNDLQENSAFVMPNRSFIINLRYATMDTVNSFYINELKLDVTIGRAVKEEVKNKHIKFLGM